MLLSLSHCKVIFDAFARFTVDKDEGADAGGGGV